MAAKMGSEEIAEGHRSERGDNDSDADTDELLTNADLLCSGASDKQRNNLNSAFAKDRTPTKFSINDDSSSASSKIIISNPTISTARRSLNFDTEKPSSEQKRREKIDRDRGADQSRSCPSTPKIDSIDKGVLKKITFSPTSKSSSNNNDTEDDSSRSLVSINADKRGKSIWPFSIPANSYAVVQFHAKIDQHDRDQDRDADDGSICEKRAEQLQSLLIEAKSELTNASQLLFRSSWNIGQNRSADSNSTSLSLEERSFLEKLSSSELRELYEAEYCKRRYSEKKIDLLQKQLLDSEQKMSVATTTLERYKNVVTRVEQSCKEFLSDVSTKDQERKRRSTILKTSNDQLKSALERVIDFGQMLGQKLESCQERAQSLEKDVESKSDSISILESDNSKFKDESIRQKSEIDNLRKKLDQSETKRKTSFEKEEQLTKELLIMERSQKDLGETVQKLKQELDREKLSRRNQLDEKEKQNKERITELAKDFDSRVERTRSEIEQKKVSELRKLKEEWDTVLYGLSEKYGRMVNERDDALRRLKEYEETFLERQRIMCYELQQRLSAKYYELLTEFSPGLPSTNNGKTTGADSPSDFQTGNGAQAMGGQYQNQISQGTTTMDPAAWLSSSMADEFLDRLRNAYPVGTPRQFGNEAANRGQGQLKQIASSSGPGQRAVPPTDNGIKKK